MNGRKNKRVETAKTSILTHRGLDLSKEHYFTESSREAFADQINRGFGLEFDLQTTKDNKLVVLHDSNLSRLTYKKDRRKISEIDLKELLAMDFSACHLVSFKDLLKMIAEQPVNHSINAVHIKSPLQKPEHLDKILDQLQSVNPEHLILFDLKVNAAGYIKGKNPRLHLAASVAHPHDIKRYNRVVGGTLLSVDDVIKNRNLYDWAWLDEWDRSDRNDGTKSLYNSDNFKRLRETGLKIALLTPELHATSPGLLGGETHQDAATKTKLKKRFEEIIGLRPDAVCTDYPDAFRHLLHIILQPDKLQETKS